MKHIRALSAVVLFLALMCGAAAADVIYTAVDDGYAASVIGTVSNNGTVKSKIYAGMPNDQAIFTFKDPAGNLRALVADRSGLSDARPDAITVFDLQNSNWSSPLLNDSNKYDLLNTNSVIAVGNYLYISSGTTSPAGGKIIKVDMTNNYNVVGNPVVFSGRQTPGDLIAVGNKIYAVITNVDGDYGSGLTYYDSEVIEYDTNLKVTNTLSFAAKNPGSNGLYNGKLYISCMGGSQGAGSIGSLWEIDLSNMSDKKKLLEFSKGSNGLGMDYMGSGLAIAPNGSAYLSLIAYDAEWNADTKLYVTTVAKIVNSDIGAEVPPQGTHVGYGYGVHWDQYANALWTTYGKYLEKRTAAGTLLQEFSPSQLGNNIYSVAVYDASSTPQQSGGSGGGSGGGCDAGAGALGLIILAAGVFAKRRIGR
ncbi:hypothetical protein FACS1894216_20600 [Synergistales bacterium]|nr:hypothetical protein FACS1894216_20600 [Synergistales bacterium]